jgi:hypothetical protein
MPIIAVVVHKPSPKEPKSEMRAPWSKQPAISRDKFVNSQKFGAMPRYSYAPLATVSLRGCDGSEGALHRATCPERLVD